MMAAWEKLAERFEIRLPGKYLTIAAGDMNIAGLAWRFLPPEEAVKLQQKLYQRYPLPDRQWNGIPFAVSNISEDIVCFDLSTPLGEEAMVLPIRDWHGPRWEYWGDRKTFAQWLASDTKGRLT